MITKSTTRGLLAGILLVIAGAFSAQASSTFVTFSVDMGTNIANGTFVPGTDTVSANGTFNNWGTGLNLIEEGTSTVYTNTINDTDDTNGGPMFYKFVINGNNYENLCDGGGNRGWILPSTSGSSVILPTPFFGDGGAPILYGSTVTFQVDMSQQINLGTFVSGVSTVDVSGNLNGWSQSAPLTLDPSIMVTNQYGLVTSNVYTGTLTSVAVSPNAHMAYQFVINGSSYEGVSGPNSDGGGNRFFTMLPISQTNPLVSYADAPYAPIVSNITFSVDMSIVALTDTNFNPASVTINGDFMGWGGTPMTNNPNAANTNIYTSPVYSDGVGAVINYQFRYTELGTGATVYDHANGANGGGGNRQFVVPNVTSTNVFAVFNDAVLSAYLLQPTAVFFSVNMANAVTTDAGAFNPSTDTVYVNGEFANWYTWSGGVNPVTAPPGYQMVEQGLTTIYTNTIIFPAGTPVDCAYKYGTDPDGANGGPTDDEAASGLNHIRVIRSTAMNPYILPTDTFGDQYGEPFFSSANTSGGNLTVGASSGGAVPVQWLGCPGARLAWSTNLSNGNWQQITATDGTNWTSGFSSTNGFVSQTNWPTAGTKVYFRLAKPN